MSEIVDVYLADKERIDLWAEHANHPLLKAMCRVLQREARKELAYSNVRGD
jgi:hypothetical protein